MNYLSVCSGIEAASVAWNPLGWEAVAFSEIEKFPCQVLQHHYPQVPNLGDMTKFKEWPNANIDVLVGGTPCQSFSIAGLRMGLDDPRGNLTLTFLAIADKYKPKYIVWENVPGVISDKSGALTLFLDGLEEIGYIVDIDILDAQFFGVPQMRRRVFVCAQSVENLMKAKTVTSALTISQCLAEILLLTFRVLRNQLATGLQDLAFDASKPKLSLKRRIKLFDLQKEEAAQKLRESLDVLQALYGQEQKDLESAIGRNGLEDIRNSGDIKSQGLTAETGVWREEFLSTAPLWSNILEDALKIAKECITSTCESETTESKIFTCAQALLCIAAPITQSMSSSPSFWSAVSSISIAIKEFTNYARSTNSSLFTELEWVRNWGDFIRKAEQADNSFGSFRSWQFGSEIFPICHSLQGNPAPSRKAGKKVAGTITAGAFNGDAGGRPEGAAGNHFVAHPAWPADIAPTLDAHYGNKMGLENQHINAGGGCLLEVAKCLVTKTRLDAETETLIPTFGGHFDAMTLPINTQIAMRHESLGESTGFGIGENGAPSFTLQEAHSHAVAHAFKVRGGCEGGGKGYLGSEESAFTLDTTQSQHLFHAMQVRRLTPRECERLQGFPDDYTKLSDKTADGPRYKALGNSMHTGTMRWIGKRIQAVDAIHKMQAVA